MKLKDTIPGRESAPLHDGLAFTGETAEFQEFMGSTKYDWLKKPVTEDQPGDEYRDNDPVKNPEKPVMLIATARGLRPVTEGQYLVRDEKGRVEVYETPFFERRFTIVD